MILTHIQTNCDPACLRQTVHHEKPSAASGSSHIEVVRKRFWLSRSGATSIEYGLIAALISVAIIGSASLLGNQVMNTYGGVSNKVAEATGN